MQRSTINFLVDAVALAVFLFLASTGVLMRYILPPGSGHFRTLWGMDRHEWGDVHFWIAVAFIAALALHLLLHWRWIVCMLRGRETQVSAARLVLVIVVLVVLVTLAGLAIAPFFVNVQRTGEPPHTMRLTERHDTEHDTIDTIDGSMTLAEVEQTTGVPASVILRELGLPSDLPPASRLGQLRKQYDFEIHDVRDIVREWGEAP